MKKNVYCYAVLYDVIWRYNGIRCVCMGILSLFLGGKFGCIFAMKNTKDWTRFFVCEKMRKKI
jgi:hypothetical protein